jgi:transposase
MSSLSVAGIDVSKARLDTFILPRRVGTGFANDDGGIVALVGHMKSSGVERVVLEATGGLEYPAARALLDAGIAVARVQPGRVRGFRSFVGKKAKTDAIDAELIARFALAMPEEKHLSVPSAEREAIRTLSARRRQLVDLLVQEKTRLKMARDEAVLHSLRIVIAALNAERLRIEKALADAIAEDEAAAHKTLLLRSIPGVGAVISTVLITDLPELGTLNRHQVASLAGLAPHPQRSGTSHAGDHIKGGRACVRTALYMAALAAIRHHPPSKAFYRRLIQDGKPRKLAIVAVARKLVVLANAIVRTNTPWDPKTLLD